MYKKVKTQNGITLIALVITIIVMLILVGVTISMAVNGGLFDYAGKAVGETKNVLNAEQELANGKIQVDGKWYASINDYLKGKELLFSYEETEKDANGMLTANATYVSGDYIAVIPKGFKVSEVEGETSIETGLVIKDENGNEFVWIPVTEDLGSSYSYSSLLDCSEPEELTSTWAPSTLATKPKYDSQEILDELYGTNYYTFSEDFKYFEEYAEMVENVNQYNGFYIGRYETTIDSDGNIGSEYNTPVLTAGTVMFTKDSTDYKYRWYGLYQAGKNANVTGNGTDVQTAMIYGVLYDKTMQFIRDQKTAGNTSYNVDTATATWHGSSNGHTGLVNSAQANPGTTGDVALNIWDLESNAYEWTQEASYSDFRIYRGGNHGDWIEASFRYSYSEPLADKTNYSSRVALYIK